MWDSYTQGFDCANPASWSEIDSGNLDTAHKASSLSLGIVCDISLTVEQAIDPDMLWASGEFQAGAFDLWDGVRTIRLFCVW